MRIVFLFLLITLSGCSSIYSDRLSKWKSNQFSSPAGFVLLIGWVPTNTNIPFNSLDSIEDDNAENQCLAFVIHNKSKHVKLNNIGPTVAQCMRDKGWELREIGSISGV